MGIDTQLVILWEQKSGFCHLLVPQSPSRDRNEPCGRPRTYSSTCSCWIGSGWEKYLLLFGQKKLKASLFLSFTCWCHRVGENIEHFSWGEIRKDHVCVLRAGVCARIKDTWKHMDNPNFLRRQKKPARLEYLHTEVGLVLLYWFI